MTRKIADLQMIVTMKMGTESFKKNCLDKSESLENLNAEEVRMLFQDIVYRLENGYASGILVDSLGNKVGTFEVQGLEEKEIQKSILEKRTLHV